MTTITIDASELRAATAWVSRALPARPATPILTGLLLTSETGVLRLSAFDYTLHTTATIPADGDPFPTPTLIPGKTLAEVAGRLHGQTTFTVDEQSVSIAAGRSRFRLRTMIADQYPATPPQAPTGATVDGAEFATALAAAVAATGRDDHGHNLTGVKLVTDHNTLTFMATDRYRLVAATIPWDGPDVDALMPGTALADAAKGMTGPMQVGYDGERLTASTAAREFTLVAKAGEYPAVDRVLGQPIPIYEALVGRDDLLDALADARLGADHQAPVQLTFAGKELTVEAEAGHGEFHAAATIPADPGDEEARPRFVFRANPDYLADQVKHCPTAITRLAFTAENKPVKITPDDSDDTYIALVMPLRGNQQ